MLRTASVLLALALISLSPCALAQAPAAETAAPAAKDTAVTPVPGISELKAKIAEITADTALEETIRTALVDHYQRALDALTAADLEQQRIVELEAVMSQGPDRLEKLREEIAQASADAQSGPSSDLDGLNAAQLEQRLLQARSDFAAAKRIESDRDLALKELTARPAAARQELSAAQSAITSIQQEKTLPRAVNETQPVFEARIAALDARLRRRHAETSRLELEMLSQDLRLDLLRLERDRAVATAKVVEMTVAALEKRLNEQRRIEAAQATAAAEQAQLEASAKHPILGAAAALNAELASEQQRVTAEVTRKSAERTRMAERANQVEAEAENTRKRLELVGMSEVLGRFLRDQRDRIFSRRTFDRESARRQDRISAISLRQIEIAEMLRSLERPERAALTAFLQSPSASGVVLDRDAILKELEALLVARRSTLEALSGAYSNELRALTELEIEQQRLAEASAKYALYLDERLLWVPSASQIDIGTIASIPSALEWLLSPRSWFEAAAAFLNLVVDNIGFSLAVAAAILGAVGLRNPLRRHVERTSKRIARVQSDRFSYTLEAILITAGTAVAAPVLLGFIGWRMRENADAGEFAQAIGAGAVDAGLVLAAATALLALCRQDGIASTHLNWSPASLALIRRHLPWWMLVTAPAVFVISTFDWQTDSLLNESLGRVAFMIQTGALAVLLHFLLHPVRGLPSRYIRQNPDGWAARLSVIWHSAIVLFPLGLMVAAATGFYYTAVSLENRLIATAAVIFAALFLHSLFVRGLQVTRRRLEYAKARARRAAEAARRGEQAATTESGVPISIEVDEADIKALNEQTNHLLRVVLGAAVLIGVYFVWADVLPALTVLSEVELWRYSGEIEGEVTTVPVSVQSIVVILFIGILVAVAAKNLPAALEIAVLQRLPLDPGLRYAIKTVSQYLIVALGFVVILSDLGVGWSNIQWLVAALSVGLGFGLQEIVANFVSGLIILFERPIRIGDTVSVGDTTGAVTKVRIRATTLLDWDNREIIVPNKTFITERLVNWTLSDAITRVIIPIGISYDSDVERARKVITDAVAGHELVIDQPPMRLLFRGLGDSSLNFELYLYVRSLADRLVVADELLEAIHAALRDNGIEIPFPQQDVHFRDIDRLEAAIAGRAQSGPTGNKSSHQTTKPARSRQASSSEEG